MIYKKKCHVKIGDYVKILSGDKKNFLGIISTIIKKRSLVKIIEIKINFFYKEQIQQKNYQFVHISNVIIWNPPKLN
jgi:ribosomal protein L24